jgi:hypothetical protein
VQIDADRTFSEPVEIAPGTEVLFAGPYTLTFAADLDAKGSAAAPIVFAPAPGVRFRSVVLQAGGALAHVHFRGAERALVIDGGSPAVAHALFQGNRSPETVALPGGAALHIRGGARPRVSASQFIDNEAEAFGFGGAVYVEGADPIFQDCLFQGNVSTYGGAFSADNMASPLVGSVFVGNEALTKGGALSLVSSVSALLANRFEDNHAGQDGGIHVCVECDPHAAPALIDNVLVGNHAARHAGGLGAAFLRDVYANSFVDNEPSDVAWFHEIDFGYPAWARDPDLSGNHWGAERRIRDGATFPQYGLLTVEPALAAPAPGEPRVVVSTRRLRYEQPGEALPVFLTLYNPGPARDFELVLLLRYGDALWPVTTPLELPQATAGRAVHRFHLAENSVFFEVPVESEVPAEVLTDHAIWYAALFAGGQRVGQASSARCDFSGPPLPSGGRGVQGFLVGQSAPPGGERWDLGPWTLVAYADALGVTDAAGVLRTVVVAGTLFDGEPIGRDPFLGWQLFREGAAVGAGHTLFY